jgi:hypothetical protein
MFLLLMASAPLSASAADDWQEKNCKHFIIYHKNVSPDYLNRLAIKAENYYKSITSRLGFNRFDFWSWDNRCKIFLYSDTDSYINATGSISWSRAHVNVLDKHIVTYAGQEEFFDIILPHEMAHIIFREFVGFDKSLPLWLDEGVAILAEADSSQRLMYAKEAVLKGAYIPLDKLSNMNNYASMDPYIFYSQSASVVDFLLDRYGRNNFVNFCRELRDNNSWQAALKKVYKIESLDDLQRRWILGVRG